MKRTNIKEAESTEDSIKAMQGNFGGDNKSQMAGVQILKFLATSDDPKANAFMKALNTATTKISKEVLGGKAESKSTKENILEAETFKCPDCGSKVLKQTGYCVSCKKKVGGKKEDIITVDEDVKIGDMILEKGDQIRVLEFSPMSGPQRGASSDFNTPDNLDYELNDFVNNYLDGEFPRDIKSNRQKGQEIYSLANDLKDSGQISFELLGYLYNLLF